MVLPAGTVNRKKKLLEESEVLIERLKKMRALNADPRLVGINPHLLGAERHQILPRKRRRY
ncbi:MAG: hypothetical protein HQ558_02655 [Candidatus Omnitrophica bacterium]|nr:hypothetical protein [Candidatus Omnitrophota bacterium]